MIRPSHFMNGIGCQKCCGHQKTDEEVKEELAKIHPNLDFSITKFSERDKNYRILVICPKHGIRKLNYYNLKWLLYFLLIVITNQIVKIKLDKYYNIF